MESTRNYRPLILLLLVFACPFIIALLVVNSIDTLRFSNSAHGKLISPVIPIDKVTDIKLSPVWNMVYIKPVYCDDNCERRIANLKSVHTLLGPRQESIVFSEIDINRIKVDVKPQSTILIDPIGNYMMYYDNDVEEKNILQDLKKLLKYSHV